VRVVGRRPIARVEGEQQVAARDRLGGDGVLAQRPGGHAGRGADGSPPSARDVP
jgi:hypothetical protein